MALVLKIKHQDTLRRWVVSDALDTEAFLLTLGQLEAKIREIFHLSPAASLVITYVDSENDVVTLGDDQDLIDACLMQRLNPLRLEVRVLDAKSNTSERTPDGSPTSAENANMDSLLRALFPQETNDAIKGFLRAHTQFIDPKLPAATLLQKAQDVFKEFLNSLAALLPSSAEKAAPCHPQKHPFTGMPNPCNGDAAFHWGVECDGCGITPIKGPRYKSTKTFNFDLCFTCFKAIGNEADYQKLDRPAHHPPFHGHYRPPCYRRGPRPFMGPPVCRPSFARGPYGWKPNCAYSGQQLNSCPAGEEHKELDARFVKDVTIFDGTELAPSTKFTKIWRMSNIGTLPWPQSTQLVHIGGDALCTKEAVNLELSEGGLPCGEDVEVSVDLTAPDKAGHYVSHWRLTAPSGQKFGQRVRVVIQVVPHGEQSPQLQESLKGGEKCKDDTNKVAVDLVSDGKTSKGLPSAGQPDLEKPGIDDHVSANDGNGNSTAASDVSNDAAVSKEKTLEFLPDIKYEIDGFSLVEKPTESTEWLEFFDEGAVESEVSEKTVGVKEEIQGRVSVDKVKAIQESLLQSLESMGFTNWDLNTLLLQKNNQNLQLTLDDLLAAAGWDGALQDLEEMGFTDKSTNIRLLVKNEGNIKWAVKDLVKLEKHAVEG